MSYQNIIDLEAETVTVKKVEETTFQKATKALAYACVAGCGLALVGMALSGEEEKVEPQFVVPSTVRTSAFSRMAMMDSNSGYEAEPESSNALLYGLGGLAGVVGATVAYLKKNMKDAPKVAAATTMAAATMASPAMAKDIANGEAVFNGNCSACHAGGNNVIQNEKTLRKEALEQYLDGGLKEASIVYQVTNGKNAMPAFGGRLDADEIEDVAAYVYDQATNAKWDS